MKTINELIQGYLKGEDSGKASNGRLRIEGDKLYSYSIVIAYRRLFIADSYELIINGDYYSPTTAKVQKMLRPPYISGNKIFCTTEVLEADLMKYLAGEVTIEQLRSNSIWSSNSLAHDGDTHLVTECPTCGDEVHLFRPYEVKKIADSVRYSFPIFCVCQKEPTGMEYKCIPITKRVNK